MGEAVNREQLAAVKQFAASIEHNFELVREALVAMAIAVDELRERMDELEEYVVDDRP